MQGPRGLLGPKGPPGIPGPPVSDTPASRPDLTPDLSSFPSFLIFHSSSPVHERFHSWTPVISALASPQEALGGPYGAVHQGSDRSQTQQKSSRKTKQALKPTDPHPAGPRWLGPSEAERNAQSDWASAVHLLGCPGIPEATALLAWPQRPACLPCLVFQGVRGMDGPHGPKGSLVSDWLREPAPLPCRALPSPVGCHFEPLPVCFLPCPLDHPGRSLTSLLCHHLLTQPDPA